MPTEFTQTQILVGSVATLVNVQAYEFIDVANLHPDCESTFYIAGDLPACSPQLGRPLPPGHSFRWPVTGSNHSFYVCAVDDFDDQRLSVVAR